MLIPIPYWPFVVWLPSPTLTLAIIRAALEPAPAPVNLPDGSRSWKEAGR